MSLMKEKYKQLKPTLEYLSDPIVLAQAWKKTHSFIRSHNWYADTLELDASTINLEENLIAWGEELADQRYEATPMRLVPAPKTDSWSFENNLWQPNKTPAKKDRDRDHLSEPLRPLAHLTIKDQTIATAIMMCMADAVETAQGPTSENNKVSSFGNRLFCTWENNKACFGWGNSTTYSKYFKDYQSFLKRTSGAAEIFNLFSNFSSPRRAIYEVHLDMSAFYDSINRETLLAQLKVTVNDYYSLSDDQTSGFWEAVSRCFKSWKWNSADKALNSCLKVPLKNDGLPQGLVASGFFANVYLLGFDSACRALLNIQQDGFIIHDYCRYVDDLRLVISIENDSDESALDTIKKRIVNMLSLLLPQGGDLKFNAEKTKLIKWASETGDAANQMKRIQSITSGPMDLDSIIHTENTLDTLFLRAETAQDEVSNSPLAEIVHPLASVHKVSLDVREDTVLRFAANRWVKVFKARRSLANADTKKSLDATQEVVARRFVASWAKNPSLTLLLKKGLQLFPSPVLLRTVWESLVAKLSDDTPLRERLIANYCLAEICRLSVIDLPKTPHTELPQNINLSDYYKYLYEQIQSLIQKPDLPWYLKQQVGLLLVQQQGFKNETFFNEDKLLSQVMAITTGRAYGVVRDVIPAALVAWQMIKDTSPVLPALSVWLKDLNTENQNQALELIAINDPELFVDLVNLLKSENSALYAVTQRLQESLGIAGSSIHEAITEWKGTYSLGAVIRSTDNPFIHENALIKLAIAVTNALLSGVKLFPSPQELSISCADWSRIQNPGAEPIEITPSISNQGGNTDSRYAMPTWLANENDAPHLYGLGCLLRACAVGSCDFTALRPLFRQDMSDRYTGLKSSWYKRRIGMTHSPEALVGETAPMSGWITELLFNLLQWPGLDTDNWEEQWPSKLNLNSLKQILETRRVHQERLYGVASDTPLYLQKIRWNDGPNNILRVVTVQSLLPKRRDFENDIELNNTPYREKHRNHLADLCNLVLKKLGAMEYANGVAVTATANLIVFPELSVHMDDVDLLQALSAKTKAMVFAGIVFHEHENKLINRALWLVPYRTNHSGLRWIKRWQGKWNMTKLEEGKITPWRPYQLLIELEGTLPLPDRGFRIAGAICYDATDMQLTADLRDHSDAFLISALNQDITTFDNMIDALHYHMYQHVILVNTGEFGGSAAKAPFKLPHHRTISQTHGNDQIAISVFEIEMTSLISDGVSTPNEEHPRRRKTKPAGIRRPGLT